MESMKYLSETQMALLFCGGFVVATVIGVLVCRPYAQRRFHGRRNANDMIGFTLQSFAAIYGILLGLLAVEAYQDFSSVQETVSKKALTLSTLYQDSDGFPQPVRARLQDHLRAYATEIVEESWPRPDAAPKASAPSPNLRSALAELLAFKPLTKGEELAQSESVQRVNTLIELRRALLASDDGIPGTMWCVVGLGAFLLMLLTCLFDMELHVHLLLAGALGLFLGAVVFLIVAMDNPFNGGLTVSPDPIREVRDVVMRPGG